MSELSEIINAIASLFWSMLWFVFLFMFRKEISKSIRRIVKGKILGQEFVLSEELVLLQQTAKEASEEVASLPSLKSKYDREISDIEEEDIFNNILKESGRFPKTALILLAIEIEKEARQTLASIGKLPGKRPLPVHQTLDVLDSHYGLPKHVSSSLKLFWALRNNIIHGGEADYNNILSAIDSGITILKTLKSLPRQVYWIHNTGVTLYSNLECTQEMLGVKGIILKTESSGGSMINYSIYPSTRTHFKKGMKVAWEWSFDKTWIEAWYKDPDTSEIKQAWSSAAEFVGRNLNEI